MAKCRSKPQLYAALVGLIERMLVELESNNPHLIARKQKAHTWRLEFEKITKKIDRYVKRYGMEESQQ